MIYGITVYFRIISDSVRTKPLSPEQEMSSVHGLFQWKASKVLQPHLFIAHQSVMEYNIFTKPSFVIFSMIDIVLEKQAFVNWFRSLDVMMQILLWIFMKVSNYEPFYNCHLEKELCRNRNDLLIWWMVGPKSIESDELDSLLHVVVESIVLSWPLPKTSVTFYLQACFPLSPELQACTSVSVSEQKSKD